MGDGASSSFFFYLLPLETADRTSRRGIQLPIAQWECYGGLRAASARHASTDPASGESVVPLYSARALLARPATHNDNATCCTRVRN